MKLNSPPMILQGCLLVLGLYLFMVFGKSILVSDSQFNILAGHAILQGNHDLRPFLDFDALQKVNDALLGNVIKLHSNDNPIASWWLSYPQFPLYLNLPFVWALERVGLSPVAGIPPMWSAMQENLMQVLIASGLMAIYGAVLMLIALRWMATRHAILVAVVMVLGTSISSNLSRAIWTDTWAVLFIMLAIAHLADAQKRKASFNALIMVTLLSFAFFCKPVYAVSVITAVVWAWWIDRRNTLIMCLLGMVYALLFYAWQQRSFSYGLMSNYQFNSYFFGFKLEYLMGLLVSPQPGDFHFLGLVASALCINFRSMAVFHSG
jgi:hypothetical protein